MKYRLTTINGITKEGKTTITGVYLCCDRIDLRYRVEIKNEFEKCRENPYTFKGSAYFRRTERELSGKS